MKSFERSSYEGVEPSQQEYAQGYHEETVVAGASLRDYYARVLSGLLRDCEHVYEAYLKYAHLSVVNECNENIIIINCDDLAIGIGLFGSKSVTRRILTVWRVVVSGSRVSTHQIRSVRPPGLAFLQEDTRNGLE